VKRHWKFRLIAKLLGKLGVASYLMQNALSMQINFHCNFNVNVLYFTFICCLQVLFL